MEAIGNLTSGTVNKRERGTVAHELDDSPVTLVDLGIDEISAQCLECRKRAFLVSPNQPRVADHVSGHNSGEAALHGNSPCRGA